MRVLFDIVHPAHVLFFLRPMRQLIERGDEILVLSRHKDITVELLDKAGIPHEPISTASRGLWGLASELVVRGARLYRRARRFRPHVMAGFGGVSISHVGSLLRIPSIGFYDSEHGTLQMRLTLPLISEWHVPDCFVGPAPAGRTRRFAGFKVLAFLHPNHFSPDIGKALKAGYDPARPNFFIRLVGWGAAHDLGHTGLDERSLRELLEWLTARGRVHISSEGRLPADLEPYRYRGDVLDVHHLLAHCRMYVGESASMASEAAVLGVPAFFLGPFRVGYIEELARAGLVQQTAAGPALYSQLQDALDLGADTYLRRRDALLSTKIDVADYVVQTLVGAARAG